MMSFRGGRLGQVTVPTSAVWLLTDIAEAKGRQALSTQRAPQLLRVLREQQIGECMKEGNWSGVEFHRNWLIAEMVTQGR